MEFPARVNEGQSSRAMIVQISAKTSSGNIEARESRSLIRTRRPPSVSSRSFMSSATSSERPPRHKKAGRAGWGRLFRPAPPPTVARKKVSAPPRQMLLRRSIAGQSEQHAKSGHGFSYAPQTGQVSTRLPARRTLGRSHRGTLNVGPEFKAMVPLTP